MQFYITRITSCTTYDVTAVSMLTYRYLLTDQSRELIEVNKSNTFSKQKAKWKLWNNPLLWMLNHYMCCHQWIRCDKVWVWGVGVWWCFGVGCGCVRVFLVWGVGVGVWGCGGVWCMGWGCGGGHVRMWWCVVYELGVWGCVGRCWDIINNFTIANRL